jgi:hypothetical protein
MLKKIKEYQKENSAASLKIQRVDGIDETPAGNKADNEPQPAGYVFILNCPEVPIGGSVDWESNWNINGKVYQVKCENSKVITDQEPVRNLLVSRGWIETNKMTLEEYQNG